MYIIVMNNAPIQGLKMQRLEERWENSCFRCKRDTWHLYSKHILPSPIYRSQLSKIGACTCKWELNVLVPLQLHLDSWFTRLILFLISVTLLTIEAFVGLPFPDTGCPVSELVDMIDRKYITLICLQLRTRQEWLSPVTILTTYISNHLRPVYLFYISLAVWSTKWKIFFIYYTHFILNIFAIGVAFDFTYVVCDPHSIDTIFVLSNYCVI